MSGDPLELSFAGSGLVAVTLGAANQPATAGLEAIGGQN